MIQKITIEIWNPLAPKILMLFVVHWKYSQYISFYALSIGSNGLRGGGVDLCENGNHVCSTTIVYPIVAMNNNIMDVHIYAYGWGSIVYTVEVVVIILRRNK